MAQMQTFRLRAIGLGCVVLTAACASAPARSVAPAARPAAVTANTWVERSAEYHAIVLQVYRQAGAYVERAAADRPARSWAVVLDADETSISNVQYQIERERAGLSYSAESWHTWVGRREAVPMPGAEVFLSRVKALGGLVAIVTNRLANHCDDTREVFRLHRLPFDIMLCRPDGQPSDKNPRFADVAAGAWTGGPVEIVAFVGDNILDFPGLNQAAKAGSPATFDEFGTRFFILPNPMYGSWEQ